MASVDPTKIKIDSDSQTTRGILQALRDWWSNGIDFGSLGKFTTLEANTLKLDTAVPASPAAGLLYASSGREVLISSTNLTGAPAAIALPGDARFAYVKVRLRHCRSVNTNVVLQMQINDGAGIQIGANTYKSERASGGVAKAFSGGGDSNVTFFLTSPADGVDNSATEGASGELTLVDPGDTTHHKHYWGELAWLSTGGGLFLRGICGGSYIGSVTPWTQILLNWSDASNFAEGQCDVYGILAV